MKRLAIAAVGLALVVALSGCTRTVERVVIITATASVPSPTPEPNLSEEEAIGLVWQRRTTATCPGSAQGDIWKDRAFCECMYWLERYEKAEGLAPLSGPGLPEGVVRVSLPEWEATLEGPGRWRVTMICSGIPRSPGQVASSPDAEWTVDDETLGIIPVSGWAD